MKHSIEAYKNRLELASAGIADQFYFAYMEDVNKILDKTRYPVIVAIWPTWELTEADHIDIKQTLVFGNVGTNTVRTTDGLQDLAESYIDAITGGQYEVIDRNKSKTVRLSPVGMTADRSSWITVDVKIRMFCEGSPVETVSGYGFLYNGHAIDSLSFAPTGWAVMTDNDWDELEELLPTGRRAAALKKLDQQFWGDYNEVIYVEELWEKFKVLPSGIRTQDGTFTERGVAANIARFIGSNVTATYLGIAADTDLVSGTMNTGFAVRLVYTGAGSPGNYLEDADGNKYNIVQIGEKYYIDADYRCTKDNNGVAINKIQDPDEWAAAEGAAYCEYE